MIYTAAPEVVKTTTIDNPSVENYEELYTDHSQSLVCPWPKISTSYKTVIDVKYTCSQMHLYTLDKD